MMAGEPNPPQYMRVNILIAIAIIVVILCMFVVVQITVKDEFAKGILTLVLGRFLGYVDNIYNFEFGTTRSSSKKDDAITKLTETAAVVAGTAQTVAATAAAPGALNPPAPAGTTLRAENVSVEANTATLTEKEPKL